MAERRSFRDIINQVRFSNNRDRKYYTGNFFASDSTYGNNNTFIQGWNTAAGEFDLDGLGNGQSNSIAVACLQVLGISFSEATLKIVTKDIEGNTQDIPNHPFSLLMRRPNMYMSGDVVQQYIINAMHVCGDAYLLKQRNESGELVALYPLMPEQVTPKGNEEELITHYIYEMDSGKVIIQKQDLVHLRLGLDPNDHKVGFSPLKTVLREVYGDESAGQMATALLANMGVPSVMITPKDEYGPSAEEAEQIAKKYQQKVGGKNRGKPLVMSGAMNVEKLSFSPKDLDLGLLRQLPEERISAVLGVPAILAGLGAGLRNATYSNAKELREFFTENKLIPLWRMVGEELTQQILIKEYEVDSTTSAEYDFSEVRALQADVNDMYQRLDVGVQGGWITIAEARQSVGLPTTPDQEVYLIPMNVNIIHGKLEPPANPELPQAQSDPQPITEDDDESLDTSNSSIHTIEKVENQFCVYDNETGKNLGCYPTKELAKDRLNQISRYGL
tara:strand:+ start:17253 stop:18758 length:1506 start_codon:yes stop_codon:yes gene_type:complete